MAKSFCNGCKYWNFIKEIDDFPGSSSFHFCSLYSEYSLAIRKRICGGKKKVKDMPIIQETKEEITQKYTHMEDSEKKVETLRRLADAMFYGASKLNITDQTLLKAMNDYREYIISEYYTVKEKQL